MARQDLPLAFHSQFPTQAAEARRVGPAEWAASCPWCGGEDRFHLFAKTAAGNDRYWCRVCDRKGFLDKNRLTPEEIERLRQRRIEQRRLERLARNTRVQQLTEQAYWRGYHDALRGVGRGEWLKRGLPDKAQDWFDLGYTLYNGQAALTIPFHNKEWNVETVQYRLLGLEGSGKYRFEKNYPAMPFYCATPDDDKPYLIVEGAIKAAVLWWTMVMQYDRPYNVVAVPCKTPGREVTERLAEEVGEAIAYLMLDPDATHDEQMRVGSHFADCRYVPMPFKVDDAINAGFYPPDVERFILAATVEPL